jgi:putative oxidoreductase
LVSEYSTRTGVSGITVRATTAFGWFGGHGLAGVSGYFEKLGFHPGRPFAIAAALSEVVSGILVVLGLLGPVGPAIMISVMIVAAVTVHWRNGVFVTSNGIEVPLLYAAGAAALALTGPGHFSLDALLGLTAPWTPVVTWTVLLFGVLGGVANLAVRRPATA